MSGAGHSLFTVTSQLVHYILWKESKRPSSVITVIVIFLRAGFMETRKRRVRHRTPPTCNMQFYYRIPIKRGGRTKTRPGAGGPRPSGRPRPSVLTKNIALLSSHYRIGDAPLHVPMLHFQTLTRQRECYIVARSLGLN